MKQLTPEHRRRVRRRFVDGLTVMRLPFAGLATWAAFELDALATVTFALAAVATDIADGIFARRWNVETEWGSNFDSIADSVFYALLVGWVGLFHPEKMREYLWIFATVFAGYAIVLLAGQLLKKSIAQHDRISRLGGTFAVTSAITFIGFGWQDWLFQLTAVLVSADVVHRSYQAITLFAEQFDVGPT
jgi:CDP-diacylglycerol--glycerol-3-phosphate 3-phosphatidyltransferase